jgi:hypothetical protein
MAGWEKANQCENRVNLLRDTIDRNTDSLILSLRGITMVDCPRCGKKVPDNMKFCGFCGIELATGKRSEPSRRASTRATLLALAPSLIF